MKGWTITQWIVAILVICGAVAIMYIALDAMGITLPPFVMRMAMVVAIVAIAIIAIGLLATVWKSWFGGGGPPGP